MNDHFWQLGPYRLHPTQGLYRGGEEVRVTPKALSVLIALMRQRGKVVTKQELFRTVWADRVVTDSALSSCIRELRRALDDDARQPRYIQTVHRRGFRILPAADDAIGTALETRWPHTETLPGRNTAIRELVALSSEVRQGGVRLAIIRGSAGIGKSTLAHHFLAELSAQGGCMTCSTECADTAADVAYGPLRAVLDQLCRGRDGQHVETTLKQVALSWWARLLHPPSATTLSGVALKTSGTTTLKQDRELRKALEQLTEHRPLALCLDDFHLSDEQSRQWLASFMEHSGEASILFVITCLDQGASDAAVEAVPPELLASERTRTIDIGPLGLDEVAECIRAWLPEAGTDRESTGRFARQILDRTGGLPLLVSATLEHWARARRPRLATIPSDAGDLIDQRLKGLSEAERDVIDAASVVGQTFSTEEVAAATERPPEEIHDALETIRRHTGLIGGRRDHTWPDGTTTSEFAFNHRLVWSRLRDRVPMARSAGMHRRIGNRLLAGWARDTPRIAARIAKHFERGGEAERATRFYIEAGAQARANGSGAVAMKHFRRALALLESLPLSQERSLMAAELYTSIGRELVYSRGLNDPKVFEFYQQALEMRQQFPASRERCQVTWRLWVYHINRGPLETADSLARELLDIAEELDDPALLLQGYHARWATALQRGDLAAVTEQARLGMSACGAGGVEDLTMGCTLHDVHTDDHNAAICAGLFAAWADALRGSKSSAITGLDAAISHARDIDHPFTLTVALAHAAGIMSVSGDAGRARLRGEEARTLARDNGFGPLEAWASIYEGWALVQLGDAVKGHELLNSGLATTGALGMPLFRPLHLALAANAQLHTAQIEAAERSLDEAFEISERNGDRLALAELHRLRGEIQAMQYENFARAQDELQAAFELGQAQGAHLWANRAVERMTELSESRAARFGETR